MSEKEDLELGESGWGEVIGATKALVFSETKEISLDLLVHWFVYVSCEAR